MGSRVRASRDCRRLYWMLVHVFLVLGSSAAPAQGQGVRTRDARPSPSPSGVIHSPKMDLLKSRLQAVEAAEDLEEPVKTQVAGLYKQAIAITETAENLARSSKEYEISLKDAPARVEKIRAQLEKPTDKPASLAFEDARGLNADQLEGRLGFQTLQLWEAQTRLADREKTLGDLRGRPEKLRQLTQDTTEQLAKSKAEPEAPETPNEPRALTEARAALTDAKEGLLQEQLRSCEQEQAGYEARLALAAAERDLAAREAFALEALVKALQSQV